MDAESSIYPQDDNTVIYGHNMKNGHIFGMLKMYGNEKEFQECQDFMEANRMFETGSTLQYGEKIRMLSTCGYSQENGRLVVVAGKLHEK